MESTPQAKQQGELVLTHAKVGLQYLSTQV